ncbi:MAG: methyltransferase domain-containing protein [Leptolyngbya sp. LCM1.Bin17]|nr:MAG: methyltransferase domain-containing protein [Leptolyngbya sp. LCM1.Bin17]
MSGLQRGFRDWVRSTPDTTLFEPGIGTGRGALSLVERGYAYTGVDVSEAMMDKLRQKIGRQWRQTPGGLTGFSRRRRE